MDHVDRTSVRIRVSRLLATADVEPPSVPPSSILIVRTLADPARGELLRDGEAGLASPRWVNAARDRLADLYRCASRPAHGTTSASALSVVFRDHAELLACLARDFLAGSIAGYWWWQAWARATRLATLDDVLREWCRAASYVPAALSILHDTRLAASFAGALSPRQARTLFVAMTDAYEIPALAAPTPADVDELFVSAAADADRPAVRHASVSRDARPPAGMTSNAPIPPWEPHLCSTSVPAALGLEQRTLLGVALVLDRVPLAVRARCFHHAFHAWRRADQLRIAAMPRVPVRTAGSTAIASIDGPPGDRAIATEQRVDESVLIRADGEEASTAPNSLPGIGQTAMAATPNERASEGPPMDAALQRGEAAPPGVSTAMDQPGAVKKLPAAAGDAGSTAKQPAGAAAVPAALQVDGSILEADSSQARTTDVIERRSVHQAEAVHTELGGVLFLINAVKHLELFERLDDHFGIAAPISGWGWLEILGRALLGPDRVTAATDPLWRALAALDRRDGPPDLTVFTRPRTSALPVLWPFDSAQGELAKGKPTSPAGITRRGGTRLLGQQVPRTLRRFLDVLVPYLRWRLVESMALGGVTPDETDARLASRLLLKRGRLTCTGTHVDLHMGMSQVDIAVRMAGLDANPGWVPALGRVVTFYYEQEIA